MPNCHPSIAHGRLRASRLHRRHVEIDLNEEVLAAVEGWRQAHGMVDQSQALGDLIVLGLMSEIGRIYRLATGAKDADASDAFPSREQAESINEAPRYPLRRPRM